MESGCPEFNEKLAGLGLDQYYDILHSNGFDTWESVSEITESDLERLHFKLGHRRKLLRAIANDQNYPAQYPLTCPCPDTSKDSSTASSTPGETTGLICQSLPTIKQTCQSPSKSQMGPPTLPQHERATIPNCASVVRTYRVNLASHHGEQQKKMIRASKSWIHTTVCETRSLEDTDEETRPSNQQEPNDGWKQPPVYSCRKEFSPDDLDSSMWDYLDF